MFSHFSLQLEPLQLAYPLEAGKQVVESTATEANSTPGPISQLAVPQTYPYWIVLRAEEAPQMERATPGKQTS